MPPAALLPSPPAGASGDALPPQQPRHWAWANLMRRAFDIDVLACPRCGGRLRCRPPSTARVRRGLRVCPSSSPAPRLRVAETSQESLDEADYPR